MASAADSTLVVLSNLERSKPEVKVRAVNPEESEVRIRPFQL
jgi:hypothetical protein